MRRGDADRKFTSGCVGTCTCSARAAANAGLARARLAKTGSYGFFQTYGCLFENYEGTRIMEKQQEIASKQAFKESLSKYIAINTGAMTDPSKTQSNQKPTFEGLLQQLDGPF